MYFMSLLEVQNVEFKYHGQTEPALKDINFEVEQGDFVSVIGANGSGKSTLAKLLNVLLRPDKGNIIVEGQNTRNKEKIWDIRKNVGMVFQNPDNQIVATMVEDDVAFGLENIAIPSSEIRKRVDHALDLVDLTGYETHETHKLSGGQKQRLAIAGIIAMEPSCIVLDEPTAMLDPQGRKEVIDTIKFLNKEKNITIVLITHFMEEASISDKVYVMNQGQIQSQGPPAEVFKKIDYLRSINLDVPVVMEVANGLKNKGVNIPDILTIDGLVDALC